jgi:ribokinase
MGNVLVIGSSNTDLVARTPRLPAPGETVTGSAFATYAGGKGANQAVAAARAGAAVVFAGAVGDDAFGLERRADLQREGIDTGHLRVIPDISSGIALILVDDRGENEIVMVPGANALVDVDHALGAAASTPHDVLSLVLEIPIETVSALVRSKRRGSRVVLNAAPFDAQIRPLLPQIDVLICNETEASQLLGAAVEARSALQAADDLVRLGCEIAVITLGAEGVALSGPGGATRFPSANVPVVDTTGAGDAFCGVLAAWLAADEPIDAAVRAAVAAGACAVMHSGAQPSLPREAEILSMMQRIAGDV